MGPIRNERKELTKGQRIVRFTKMISAFRLVDESMPLQTLAVFLEIAREPGISLVDIASRTGLASSSTSRNVAALSEWHWQKRPGLGLVEVKPDLMELRRKACFLTPQGERLLDQALTTMEG